jgi:septum formation protein
MILASKSPRRHEIMKNAGFEFRVIVPELDEKYPGSLNVEEIPVYLAECKAEAVAAKHRNELVIGADTIVLLDGNILGKPVDDKHAKQMLTSLSGKKHTVITGVCVILKDKKFSFNAFTDVWFSRLSKEEIEYYVLNYKPLDKAGSYGVQDFIGMAAIEHIEGSFYNVMGLPIHKLYQVLRDQFGVSFT